MAIAIKKVLISDNVDKKCEDLLKQNDINVVCKFNLSTVELIEELKDCDGLIVRSDTKVTKEVIEASKSLAVIGRAGTGIDNIDVNAATKKGIIVLNAPNGNSISACELTCSLITCLARNVPAACQSMQESKWDRKVYSGGCELNGKTLAVIGLGRIGKEVAFRMKSFGMQIIGFDPFVTCEEAHALSIKRLELEDIWPLADYITVHTPLIPQTKNLLNKSVFEKCKRGVRIVNVARGGIVNEEDLFNALKLGTCGGAALDVFSEEPPTSASLKKLLCHSKVITTPHLGASTKEAQVRVAVEVAEQFVSLKDTNSKFPVAGVINAPALLASRQAGNVGWMKLAELLGRVVSRILNKKMLKGANVVISLIGPEIQNMKFLSSSVLLGILSDDDHGDFNLINSPFYAAESGLNFSFDTSDNPCCIANLAKNIMKISLRENAHVVSAEGTIINDVPYLLQINDAVFQPTTVHLNKEIQIYSCKPDDLANALNTAIKANPVLSNLSVAHGQQCWLIVACEKCDRSVSMPANISRIRME